MSRHSALGWPSFGFFMLVTSYIGLVGLLWWGWHKPVLDQAFEILIRRDLSSEVEFSPAEVNLLRRVWAEHPGLGRALTGRASVRFLEPTSAGWLSRSHAHLAVRVDKDRKTQFSFEVKGQPEEFPVTIELSGGGMSRKFELASGQPLPVEFSSDELKRSTILDVLLTPAVSPTPSWAVRILPVASSPMRENP